MIHLGGGSFCDDVRGIPYNDLHSAEILYDFLHSLLRKSLTMKALYDNLHSKGALLTFYILWEALSLNQVPMGCQKV